MDIDSKYQLYVLARQKTYNVRAFSSMMGETFFADLTMQDSRGHGAVTCEDFKRYIGKDDVGYSMMNTSIFVFSDICKFNF